MPTAPLRHRLAAAGAQILLRRRPPARPPAWLAAALLYLAIALAFTYPLVTQLGTHLAGDDSDSADVRESVWGVWWWRQSLLPVPGNPLHISALNHPDGLTFNLYPLMAQPFAAGAGLAALVSPVAAYNILVLAAFALSGLAGWALCQEVTGDPVASFLGGLIWAFFPAKTAHVVAGHLALFFVAGLPLAAVALRRLLASPSWRRAALAAVALAAGLTIHPIYVPYVMVPLVLGLLIEAVARDGQVFWRRERILPVAGALGLGGAAGLALAWPALAASAAGQPVFANVTADVIGRSPDLLAYLTPSSDHPLWAAGPLHDWAVRIVPYQYEQLTFVGFSVLALALVGARQARPTSRLWAWLAAGAGVLALGPLLRLGGDFLAVHVAGEPFRVVLPYAFLADLPLLQWSRTPGRLTVLLMLAAAVLASLGAQQLLRKARPLAARPLLTAAVVSLIILVEYLVRVPFPTFEATAPAAAAALGRQTDGLAVIQLPAATYADNQQALFWQTTHAHPLVGGRVYQDRPEADRTAAFFRSLVLDRGLNDLVAAPDPISRLGVLREAGVGWVLVDRTAPTSPVLEPGLTRELGSPRVADERSALYAFPPAPAPTGPVWQTGPGWEDVGGARRFCGQGVVYVYLPRAVRSGIGFWAAESGQPVDFDLTVNGRPAGRFHLGAPGELASQPVDLRAGLNTLMFFSAVQPPQGGGCAALGGPESGWGPAIQGVHLADERPPVAVFGGVVGLVDGRLPQSVPAGGVLPVTVTWQAMAEPGQDLTAFVHVVNAAGQLAAQHDGPPGAGAPPTSQWGTGDLVREVVTVPLPAGLPSGRYTVMAGLYSSATLDRLPLAGGLAGADAITLGEITVLP